MTPSPALKVFEEGVRGRKLFSKSSFPASPIQQFLKSFQHPGAPFSCAFWSLFGKKCGYMVFLEWKTWVFHTLSNSLLKTRKACKKAFRRAHSVLLFFS
jgi:hypothetical protein